MAWRNVASRDMTKHTDTYMIPEPTASLAVGEMVASDAAPLTCFSAHTGDTGSWVSHDPCLLDQLLLRKARKRPRRCPKESQKRARRWPETTPQGGGPNTKNPKPRRGKEGGKGGGGGRGETIPPLPKTTRPHWSGWVGRIALYDMRCRDNTLFSVQCSDVT